MNKCYVSLCQQKWDVAEYIYLSTINKYTCEVLSCFTPLHVCFSILPIYLKAGLTCFFADSHLVS